MHKTTHQSYAYDYAFGMLHAARHYTLSEEYKFGFNGKEMDNDWNGKTGATYDYGFRIYDARIAKFMSVDPLTKSYPWYTPYQFAGNTPIAAIDLDGLEELIVIRWYDGDKYKGQSYIYVPDAQRVFDEGVVYVNADYTSADEREFWNLYANPGWSNGAETNYPRPYACYKFTNEQIRYVFSQNNNGDYVVNPNVKYSMEPVNKVEANRKVQMKQEYASGG
jgi:RHS repeat-associated protein